MKPTPHNSQNQSPKLEITIEIPDGTPRKKVTELVKQAALRADMTHRAYSGHGLKAESVVIRE